jgi:hypothetical protein
MTGPDQFGPWAAGLDPAERLARYRSLRALCQLFCGPRHPLVVALAAAEADPADEAAALAWQALLTLPSLQRRRILQPRHPYANINLDPAEWLWMTLTPVLN